MKAALIPALALVGSVATTDVKAILRRDEPTCEKEGQGVTNSVCEKLIDALKENEGTATVLEKEGEWHSIECLPVCAVSVKPDEAGTQVVNKDLIEDVQAIRDKCGKEDEGVTADDDIWWTGEVYHDGITVSVYRARDGNCPTPA